MSTKAPHGPCRVSKILIATRPAGQSAHIAGSRHHRPRPESASRFTNYLVRFTAPEFTTLCPITGQPDFAHLVIDYVPGQWLVESKSLEALSDELPQSSAASTKTAPSRSASVSRKRLSRAGCASAAIGIRAAAFPSTCSGRPDDYPEDLWVPDQGVPPYRGRG